jgi:hypothetical protein
MKDNRSICKKGEFIDEVFGENVEYVRIYDDKGITIIFGMDNQIIIKKFKNTKELIEKFIEKYMECEFSDQLWQEQECEINALEKANRELNGYLKEIFNCIDKNENLCNSCRKVEE